MTPRAAARSSDRNLCLSIPSSLAAIDPLCRRVRALLARHDLTHMQFPVEILARECLNNAILHGNRKRAHSRVSFGMRIGRKLICLRIADRGPGFSPRRYRRRRWPAADEVQGRGLLIFEIYAERIAFNRRGNSVTLWINIARAGRHADNSGRSNRVSGPSIS